MKIINKLCLSIFFLVLVTIGASGLFAAVPPEPTYGTATVDGITTEWDLVNDFFGYMYRAGNPAKPIESSVHLRYDCSTHTVYVLVLTNGVPGVDGPTYAPAAWSAINTISNKVYTGNTGNDGTPPDFAWVGLKYDGVPDHVQGYEASFHLDPGSYKIIVHIEVFDSGGFQTSATMGFPGDGILLLLDCTKVADPDIHMNKLISIDGMTTWLDAETPPGPTVWQNSELYYKFVVTNTGNTELTNITLEDSMYDVSSCTITDPLPVGGEFECVIGPVTAGLGPFTNTAEATGDYGGTTYTDTHLAYYTGERRPEPGISVLKFTNGMDANQRPGPEIFVGETVKWKYIVTNTGNVDLTNVTVTDDRLGLIGVADPSDTIFPSVCYYVSPDDPITVPFDLATGATVTCEKYRYAEAGQYDNTATASGFYGTHEYKANALSHYYGTIPMPEIRVVKLTQGYDWAHQPPGPYVLVGGDVKWEYIVTNIGNVPLTGVTLTDNMLLDDVSDCYDSLLTPLTPPFDLGIRESAVCVATGLAEMGQYSNTATATGTPPYNLPDVTGTDISHYFGADPGIAIAKYTNGEPAPYILPGSPVTWTYLVTNTGNVELTNVKVTDNMLGTDPVCTIASLPAAEITTCTATGTAGSIPYSNTATVTGTAPGGLGDYDATASSQYDIAIPGIDLLKYVSVDGKKTWFDAKVYPWPQVLLPGQIFYKFVVKNTGNVPLTEVTLTDTVAQCTVPTTLAPLQSYECVFGPLPAYYGLNTNNATATGKFGGNTYTDIDFATYFGTLCSYTQGGYQGGGKPGLLLKNNFITLFPLGLEAGIYNPGNSTTVPNGYKWEGTATGLKNLQTYLAGGGTSGAIVKDALNPTKDEISKTVPVSGGTLARQAATVTLNIKFSANALSMPAGYGELLYCNPGAGDSLSGQSISAILGVANNALANGLNGLPDGYSYASLNSLLNYLNRAFDNCVATDWAQTYLKETCP